MFKVFCPKCKSFNVIPVVWGLVEDKYEEDRELLQLEKEERVWLGGCITRDEEMDECEDEEAANIFCRNVKSFQGFRRRIKMFDDLIKKRRKLRVYMAPLSSIITASQAIKFMRDAFDKDDGLVEGYVANVAMLLHDRYGITDCDQRNRAAEDILQLIFYFGEKGDPVWRRHK